MSDDPIQVTCVAAVSLTAGSFLSDFFERLLPCIIIKVIMMKKRSCMMKLTYIYGRRLKQYRNFNKLMVLKVHNQTHVLHPPKSPFYQPRLLWITLLSGVVAAGGVYFHVQLLQYIYVNIFIIHIHISVIIICHLQVWLSSTGLD